MKDDLLTRAARVESPRAAAVFADPKRRRILAQFLGRERSLSEVGQVLDMKLNRLLHHVRSFQKLGLLEVVSERKRAGRPIRLYRAAADAFLVPAELMQRRAGDSLARELGAALERAERVSGRGDMLLHLDGKGRPRIAQVGGDEESEASEYWRVLALSRRDAAELGGRLAALLRDYEERGGRGASPYLIHVAVAPRGS